MSSVVYNNIYVVCIIINVRLYGVTYSDSETTKPRLAPNFALVFLEIREVFFAKLIG